MKGGGLGARRRIIPLLTKEGLGEVKDGVVGELNGLGFMVGAA